MSRALAALALALAGCGAGVAEQARADRIAGDERYAAAERAYSRREDALAERLFLEISNDSDAEVAALAVYRRAQLRERAGDFDAALHLYRQAEALPTRERRAFAAWRAAKLIVEKQGRPAEGRVELKRVIDTYPGASAADRAAKYLALRRQPAEEHDRALDTETVRWMLDAAERWQEKSVGDNLLFFAAWAQIHRQGDLGGARTTLRRLTQRYFVSPLLDDALWLLAGIERRQGRYDEALALYEAILHIRVDQDYLILGYRSRRLDDAAIATGLVQLHLRRDLAGAEVAFRRLLDEFPTSVFRDDAWWGLAGTLAAAERPEAAREALRSLLKERPDSHFAKQAKAALDGTGPMPGPTPDAAAATFLHPRGKGVL